MGKSSVMSPYPVTARLRRPGADATSCSSCCLLHARRPCCRVGALWPDSMAEARTASAPAAGARGQLEVVVVELPGSHAPPCPSLPHSSRTPAADTEKRAPPEP